MKTVETVQSGGGRKAPVWSTLFKMLRKSKLPWGWLILTLAIMFGYSYIYLLFPDYTEQVINGDISQQTITSFIIVVLGGLVLGTVQTLVSGITNAKMAKGMQNTTWKVISQLPVAQIERENIKELLSRVTSDTNSVSTLLASSLPNFLQGLYMIAGSFAAVSDYDKSMLITLFVLLAVQAIATFIVGKINFKAFEKLQKKLAEMTKLVAEVMSNLGLVKFFSAEEREGERGNHYLREFFRQDLFARLFNGGSLYLSNLINLIGQLVVIVMGGHLVHEGQMEIGSWIAYFLYYRIMGISMWALLADWRSVKAAQGKLRRLSLLITASEEDLTGGERFSPCGGDFAFENVSFGYGKKPVLNQVSFTVPARKLTAITGENGAGKTTALSLLERFYIEDSGRVTYAGKDAAKLNLSDWRALFSYVPQDVRLMSGTLRENLTYGVGREVSEQELAEACRRSRADHFISRLPQGLDTPVEEFGDNFSGGQRQQIAIARAILRDRECLLLDEFTSNLDPESEDHVLEALEELRREKTVVIIAHKMSTVEKADNIVYLENGAVEAIGSHQALMKESSGYRAMVQAQTAAAH